MTSQQDKLSEEIRKILVELIQTSSLESIRDYFASSGSTADKKARNDCILLPFDEPAKDLKRLKRQRESKKSLKMKLGHWSIIGNVQTEMKERMNSNPAFSEAIKMMSPQLHDSIKKAFSIPVPHFIILPLISLETYDRQYYPLDAIHLPHPTWFETKWNMKTTVNHFFKVPSIFITYFPQTIKLEHKLLLKDFASFTFDTMIKNIKSIQEMIRMKVSKICNRDFCHKDTKESVTCESCFVPLYCNDGCLLKDRTNHAKDCERWSIKKPQNFTNDWSFCCVKM